MAETPEAAPAATPAATAAVAQTREGAGPGPVACRPGDQPTGAVDYALGPGVERAVSVQPYERKGTDPIYRPLKIFTLDPAVSRLDGATALVNVPYEPLAPGPVGSVFEVDDYDSCADYRSRPVDLEEPTVLLLSGRSPSTSDRLFHQQMVYAVASTVYATFRAALGRHIGWGFERGGHSRLRLRPHAFEGANAYYAREAGEVAFGYYRAVNQVAGGNLPGGTVYTCLSHDIVVHELTHALLDGMRSHFTVASSPDVLAFHEGFADLIAILQHFSYDGVLKAAIRRSRGDLERAELLMGLARQFGHTTGREGALRSAVDPDPSDPPKLVYNPDLEAHVLGSVLVTAVFDAFSVLFERKTERYVRLATGGSGVLPAGELSQDLQAVLATEASQLASQFLSVCIRAIDYCPPVDVHFGDFLRAVITADQDLVPDDPWGYREAWIFAFGRRGIYPEGVDNLSEDALLWEPPPRSLGPIEELTFANLRFEGDPGRPAGASELRRQGQALGAYVCRPEHLAAFGLARPGDPLLGGDEVGKPTVESIRSSRRVGPDRQIVFDLVAEVTQRRLVRGDGRHTPFEFYGGATVILNPRGEIRYIVRKNILKQERLERQRAFLSGAGHRLWEKSESGLVPKRQLFKMLHDHRKRV